MYLTPEITFVPVPDARKSGEIIVGPNDTAPTVGADGQEQVASPAGNAFTHEIASPNAAPQEPLATQSPVRDLIRGPATAAPKVELDEAALLLLRAADYIEKHGKSHCTGPGGAKYRTRHLGRLALSSVHRSEKTKEQTMSDASVVKHLEAPRVGRIKLSEAIRECGYSDAHSYNTCVIGRSYKRICGHWLWEADTGDERRPFLAHAARILGVPFRIIEKAEDMCFENRPASEIAAYVKSEGY